MLSTVRRSSKFNKGLALSISLPKVLAKKILIALYGFVLFGFSLYVSCIHCPTLKYYERCMGKLNYNKFVLTAVQINSTLEIYENKQVRCDTSKLEIRQS